MSTFIKVRTALKGFRVSSGVLTEADAWSIIVHLQKNDFAVIKKSPLRFNYSRNARTDIPHQPRKKKATP